MNIALILAAGVSSRLPNEYPKQFIKTNDKYLFAYSVEAFENSNVDAFYIICQKDYFDLVKTSCHQYKKFKGVIEGSTTRQLSVFNALLFLKEKNVTCNNILVHDSARPLITTNTINSLLDKIKDNKAITLASKTTDSIAKIQDDKIDIVLNRNELINIETPQVFDFNLLLKAHMYAKENNISNATDDSQLVIMLGEKVNYLLNNESNLKITTPKDLEYFEYKTRGDLHNGK